MQSVLHRGLLIRFHAIDIIPFWSVTPSEPGIREVPVQDGDLIVNLGSVVVRDHSALASNINRRILYNLRGISMVSPV